MEIYETVQGDTFDSIAKKLYGNEKMAKDLFDVNVPLCGIVVFASGVKINVPTPSMQMHNNGALPSWRTP